MSKTKGFKLVAAIDNEQIGWSGGDNGKTVDIFSCSGGVYIHKEMGDAFQALVGKFSTLQVKRGCMGANSDHYAMWEIGVPAVVYSEHDPFRNPHFDENGGDTFDRIDLSYFFRIAQVGATYAASLVGLPAAFFTEEMPMNLLTFFQPDSR